MEAAAYSRRFQRLKSLPAEVSFTVTEGWEIIGNIIPEIGERNRKMMYQLMPTGKVSQMKSI